MGWLGWGLLGAVGVVALGAVWLGHLVGRALALPDGAPTAFLSGPRPNGPVVVCVGDSLTHGRLGYDWVAGLRGRFVGTTFVNAGINGHMAYSVRQRVDEVLDCRPDVVVLLIGANDVLGFVDPIAAIQKIRKHRLPQVPDIVFFETCLVEVVDRILGESTAQLALVALPYIGEDDQDPSWGAVDAYNDAIRSVADKRHLPVLSLDTALSALLAARSAPSRTAYGGYIALKRRIGRAIVLRYGLGWSWDRIGDGLDLLATMDTVHLNERSGALLEDLVAGFLEENLAAISRPPR